MQITICDKCKKEIDAFELSIQSEDSTRYRFLVQKVSDRTGRVRRIWWKGVDVCQECFLKLLEELATKELSKTKPIQCARAGTAEGVCEQPLTAVAPH